MNWLKRFRKPRVLKIRPGENVLLVHNGEAWVDVILTEVTNTFNEGTVATFVSRDRLMNGRLR